MVPKLSWPSKSFGPLGNWPSKSFGPLGRTVLPSRFRTLLQEWFWYQLWRFTSLVFVPLRPLCLENLKKKCHPIQQDRKVLVKGMRWGPNLHVRHIIDTTPVLLTLGINKNSSLFACTIMWEKINFHLTGSLVAWNNWTNYGCESCFIHLEIQSQLFPPRTCGNFW